MLHEHYPKSDDVLEIACRELMKKRFIDLPGIIKTGVHCRHFDIIDNELWIVEHSTVTIHIFSLDGTKLRQISRPELLGKVSAVIRFNGKALVCTERGLFTIETDQSNYVIKVSDGNFCHASVKGSVVFSLSATEPKIIQYDSKDDLFVKQKEFKLKIFRLAT